jgi:hypothetical protein
MSSSTDRFCPQCAEINFNFFTKRFQKDQDNEKLPDISWSTLLPEHCQFCQLLLHCICNGQDIHQTLQGTLRGVYTGHELQLYADDKETSRRLDYSIRHCESTPSSYPNEELQNSAYFDVNELKFWLNQCESHQCLPGDHSHNPLPEDFRLIDVQNNCVVRPKSHVKYCALSYVWGGVVQPSLTSYNTFEPQNSLKALDLPRTILDAMALCREIGCQFLWVDSLCIVQDSEDDKHSQIRSMANVYSQSFLAIIAAAGDDANAGLPLYSNPRRNSNLSYLVRRSSKGSFVATLSPQIAAQEIAKSSWASRGWTLQEYALSRRVLFFTGSYTFLRCEKGLRCEDFGLGFSNCFEEDLKWDLPLPRFYRRTSDPDRHYSSTFSQLLAQFVRRSLRYDEDILAAFTGILTRMEDSIGTHIWGLPSKEFGAALQWTTNLPFPSTERVGFPSWSWAGWIHTNNFPSPNGSFHDMYEGFDKRATNMSVLTCYTVGDNKDIHTVEECNLDRISLRFKKAKQRHQRSNDTTEIARLEMELRRLFTPQPCQELQTYIELQSPSKPPLSHHIFLWASCTSLYVDRPPEVMKCLETWDLLIRIKEGARPIGSIRLKSEWRETEPDYMDFFVSTVGVHSPPSPSPHPVQLKFKVILMKLYHNTKPPVYKRIQVSHAEICQTDWTLANPESRLIALV